MLGLNNRVNEVIPIHQYRNKSGDSFYSNGLLPIPTGYTIVKERAFGLFSEASSLLYPLYQCNWNKSYFLTTDPSCEGKFSVTSVLGYISKTIVDNVETKLYRCVLGTTGEHIVTLDPSSCLGKNTYTLEGSLGYIPLFLSEYP